MDRLYDRIMVPVDLQHLDSMARALTTAVDVARRYGSSLWFVAVTGKVPNPAAPTPEEFSARLDEFAEQQRRVYGLEVHSRAVSSVDIAVELDHILLSLAEEIGADLIVMASHVPGVADRVHLIGSSAAHLVRHSHASVFVVRQSAGAEGEP
jgi:universal stress protein F